MESASNQRVRALLMRQNSIREKTNQNMQVVGIPNPRNRALTGVLVDRLHVNCTIRSPTRGPSQEVQHRHVAPRGPVRELPHALPGTDAAPDSRFALSRAVLHFGFRCLQPRPLQKTGKQSLVATRESIYVTARCSRPRAWPYLSP